MCTKWFWSLVIDSLHKKPYSHFPNALKKWSFQNKSLWSTIFLLSSGKAIFFFPKRLYFLQRENERWHFSKNTWGYDIFCMLVKVVYLFHTNIKLPFCQKSQDVLLPKNTPKDDISGITKKEMIFILEKMILTFSVLLWRSF